MEALRAAIESALYTPVSVQRKGQIYQVRTSPKAGKAIRGVIGEGSTELEAFQMAGWRVAAWCKGVIDAHARIADGGIGLFGDRAAHIVAQWTKNRNAILALLDD